MDRYADRIEKFTLIEGKGGVYELRIDDQLRFSKKSLGRFPEDEEVFRLFGAD